MPSPEDTKRPGFNVLGTLIVLAIIAVIFAAGGFGDLYHFRGHTPPAATMTAPASR